MKSLLLQVKEFNKSVYADKYVVNENEKSQNQEVTSLSKEDGKSHKDHVSQIYIMYTVYYTV